MKVGARGRGEELSGSSLAYVTASHSWTGLKKKKVLQWPSLNTGTHTRILAWCVVRADLRAWFLLSLSFALLLF